MKKFTLTLLALLSLAFSATSQNYYENEDWRYFMYDSLIYRIMPDNTAELVSDISIPASYPSNILTVPQTVYDSNGTAYTVTRIGAYSMAFLPSTVDSIELPESIVAIGDCAFHDACISHITLPTGLRWIGDYAFINCFLTGRVTLPDSLENLGLMAFGFNRSGRNNINDFYIDPSNRHFCTVDGVIYSKDTTVAVFAPRGIGSSITMPQSVRRIESGAYSSCTRASEIYLGDSVRELGLQILPSTINLFNIPASVVHMEGPVNQEFRLAFTLTVDPMNTHYTLGNGMLRSTDGDTLVMCVGSWSGDKALPEGIKVICPYVFFNNGSLHNLVLPTTLEDIGTFAFANSNIHLSELPYPVRHLGAYWLSDNRGMVDTLVLPSAALQLDTDAFAECRLAMVVLPDALTTIPRGLFRDCLNLSNVVVGSHLEQIEPYAFDQRGRSYNGLPQRFIQGSRWDRPLRINSLPATLRTVGCNAFFYRVLDSVVFLGSPDTIGEMAFDSCARVVFHDSLPPVVYPNAFRATDTVVVPCGAAYAFTNAPGWGSAFTYIEMPCPVAVDEAETARAVTVDPNPTTKMATVRSDSRITQIEAFDATGAKIYGLYTYCNSTTLDVSRWPTGSYLLRIHTPQGVITRKLMVAR